MSINIPFSKDEILRLINLYTEEEKILVEKLDIVRSTLNVLNQSVNKKNENSSREVNAKLEKLSTELTTENRQKRVIEKYNIPKVPESKRGRKSKKSKNVVKKEISSLSEINFRNFIVSSIRNQNEIMNAEMLTNWLISEFSIKKFSAEIIYEKIIQELVNLSSENILINTKIQGQIFYGYSLWFDQKGNVKREYASTYKIIPDATNATEPIKMEEAPPVNILQNKIIELLEESKHLLTLDEFYQRIENVDKMEVLQNALEEMRIDGKLKRIPVPSSRDDFQYGLINWFKKGDGTLKVYYMAHK